MVILYRIACLLGGYAFGLFQTSYIYGKMNGIDIREHGSGNSGTTNALRVLGNKAGLIVLLGDFFKCLIACMIAKVVFHHVAPDMETLMVIYTGLGVGLGHIFPFYMGFKGGKGIAVAAAIILSLLNIWIILICLFSFIIVVYITRYVSLGSIIVMLELVTGYAAFAYQGYFNLAEQFYIESIIVLGIYSALAIYMHRANIVRLLRHEENKFSFHKKEKKEE